MNTLHSVSRLGRATQIVTVSVPKMNTLYSVSRLGRTTQILTVSVPKMNTLYKPLHTSSRCISNSSDYRHVTLLTDYTQGLAKLKFLASSTA